MLVMDSLYSFLAVFDAFCSGRGIAETRASTLILNGGGRIGAIRSGKSDVGVKTLAKAMQLMSDTWPPDTVWPADVPRPPPSDSTAPGGSSSDNPGLQIAGAAA